MDTTALHPVLEGAIAVLLLVGGAFCLVGAVGLVRFGDFFMRLHAPTKASTLGVGGALAAAVLWHWGHGEWSVRELLIAAFLFLTAPVSANLLALAGLHLRAPSAVSPPTGVDGTD